MSSYALVGNIKEVRKKKSEWQIVDGIFVMSILAFEALSRNSRKGHEYSPLAGNREMTRTISIAYRLDLGGIWRLESECLGLLLNKVSERGLLGARTNEYESRPETSVGQNRCQKIFKIFEMQIKIVMSHIHCSDESCKSFKSIRIRKLLLV